MKREHRQKICRGAQLLVFWGAGFLAVLGLDYSYALGNKYASPRAAAASSGVAMQQFTVASAASGLALPAAPSLAPATNRTLRAVLAWDAAAEHGLLTNYAVHYGGVSQSYTNVLNAGTNLTLTISNLLPRTRYYFALSSRGPNAFTALSPEIVWPVPVTNYLGVGIKTNGRVIVQLLYTNPPGDVVLFEPFIWQTNNQVAVVRLPSGNLIVGNTNNP